MASAGDLRIGYGEDAHALAIGRPLVLGGLAIADSPAGAVAVSDGDALLHALADALLSAFALGDIGELFPTGNPASLGLASSTIVAAVLERLRQEVGEVSVLNVSAVVTLDAPRLSSLRDEISASVARLLGLSPAQVGLGFKTSEGLAPGHMQARVTVLLRAGGR